MEHTIYLIFAVVGCTLVLAQAVLLVLGFAGDGDLDTDHDVGADHDFGADQDFDHDGDHGAEGHGNLFFGILSFKALCAFAGVFGLTGLVLEDHSMSPSVRVLFAAGAGFVVMLAVARLMIAMSHLQSSGTVDIRNAVGHSGTVYVRVPGENTGWGKVTVEVQGRSLELRAVTDGPELKSGALVSVVGLAGDETLKVERIR